MMSMHEAEARPSKRQRLSSDGTSSPGLEHDSSRPPQPRKVDTSAVSKGGRIKDVAFDPDVLESFIGEKLPTSTFNYLYSAAGGNIERAVNLYFDGSWRLRLDDTPPTQSAVAAARATSQDVKSSPPTLQKKDSQKTRMDRLADMPDKRYIGAFGVTGWATKSGTNVLRSDEKVKIERTKPQSQGLKMGRGGKMRVNVKRQDVIVRFTNARGDEVGRLEQEVATWLSALIDSGVALFEGHCVYAPDRLKTNDTVYLQLRCYLRRRIFDSENFVKPTENNRATGIFEAKETQDERDLRLRQVGLVKLFSEINLNPSRVNEATQRGSRQNILQAAERDDIEKKDKDKPTSTNENGGSSPPSEENEDGQELEQDQLDTLYKKAQSFDFDTPEMQPAPTFAMDLRKYQKQALHWMVGKERDEKAKKDEVSMHPLWEEYIWPIKDVEDKDLPAVDGQDHFYMNPYSGELSLEFPQQDQHCLGGILADEMGLGKTIEMLSLVHTHTSEYGLGGGSSGRTSIMDLPRLPGNSATLERAPCTTLVVAPMSLLAQWASEAEKASKPGTLKTLLYYGGDRDTHLNLQSLCCTANAANAPNVIITSYGTVLSEFNKVTNAGGNKSQNGGLFSLEYFRVILDEAHMIKNRQSKTARACYEISAEHRWTLTGTPIVNRLEDLFSLVRFLRVEPWSNFSFWKTFITVPFEAGDFLRALNVVQTVLEPLVMRRTKDMKTPDGQALVPLPPKAIDVEKVQLSKDERALYDHIFVRAKRTFSANVEAGTLMKSYTTIFAQILRLRQSCCHPVMTRNKNVVADEEESAAAADIANGLADDMDLQSLIERFEADEGEQDAARFGAHVLRQIQSEADAECPICSEEPMIEQAVTGCWHSACKKCLLDYIEHQASKGELPRCFNCREPINARDVFEVVRHDDDEAEAAGTDSDLYAMSQAKSESPAVPRITLTRVNQVSSAKINALLGHLKRLKKTEPQAKSVIFSQFTSFLDLIAPSLTAAGISFLRFDGTMAQKARATVLTEFANRPKGCVLLLSLRAGGVGLNLTCAKRVYMMDPWWSWAVEAQAIDRVHRMGQTDDVTVTRFVVEGSIEEKMLKVQERKKFIASSLGMMSDEEKKEQRIEDIRELLS